MSDQAPTREQVEELLAYLTAFSRPGRQFIVAIHGGVPDEHGVVQWPHPEYEDDVVAFFMRLGCEPWADYGYNTERTRELAQSPELLASATLDEVRAVLTYCSRGERFCDGHWYAMLRQGIVAAALRRLDELVPAAS